MFIQMLALNSIVRRRCSCVRRRRRQPLTVDVKRDRRERARARSYAPRVASTVGAEFRARHRVRWSLERAPRIATPEALATPHRGATARE